MQRIGIRFAPAEAATEVALGTVPATVAPPPNARVAVAAIIPGVVTRTLVVEGESVRAGQPLAVIASRELYAMGAALESASARVAVARANDARLGQLAREGVIAGARADEARAALREAEAGLGEQRRVLALINGRPRSGSYTLSAPIAGKVTSATIQTGSPVDGATAAYVIDAADRYELTAQLPAHMIGQVRPGMGVSIGGDVRGTVTSVASVVDPATRSAMLRARLPATPGVVSGRVTSATLFGPAPAGAVSVPTSAVLAIDGADTVFVRADGGVVPRKVTSGGAAGGRTVLLSGLKAGEPVAVSGASELKSLAAAR
ncbi:efflux RND transporter periplasmic adaptor subunit [Sphingomonas sp. XMGL2]|uniref:Efflux RND transporter periplasmic adaptor subunit n=2 Tax=Sphingomonas quercus TaxID=2842451 RepID=A0ABS6BGV1_9SPHN|nr:efflux RND transporter periplasmic adaptor subunit [Sphingomonas quercus]MBU3076807.1 efflux RND transporter periplasmic adaptor subunit [Sphingomonas quercus]